MLALKNNIERLSNHFTDDFCEPFATRIFFRSLVLYTLLKVSLTWPLSRMIAVHHTISFPRSLAAKILVGPAYLYSQTPDIFYASVICLLVAIIILDPSYLTNTVFFWLALNLYIINLPITNGSDIVLFMLAIWCIPLSRRPVFKEPYPKVLQITAHNLALICCQLQVVFIYLGSGIDKLLSEVWRSGEAFEYIRHLEVLYNPVLPSFFANDLWNPILSWATILFELLLVALVWTKKFRIPALITGMIFHLFIWIVLSLPDFALMMMISLMIFMKDSDYDAMKKWIRRLLPLK